MSKGMNIYAELDNFVEENEGQVTLTDIAKHFADYGYQYALQHPQWIPVEKELPKERGKLYLVCNKYGMVGESAYDVEDDIWYRQSGTVLSPTHWMTMPQPPRKEE